MNVARADSKNSKYLPHLLTNIDEAFFTVFGERISAQQGRKARFREALAVLGEAFPIEASVLIVDGDDAVHSPFILQGGLGWEQADLSESIRRWRQGDAIPEDGDRSRFDLHDGDHRCGVLLLRPRLSEEDAESVRWILRFLMYLLRAANADLEASHWDVLHSHHVLQALFDAITAEMYIIDSKYSLVSVNAACAAAAGTPQEDLLGKRCYAALADRNQPCPGCLAAQTAFRGTRLEWEKRRWNETGEPSLFEITAYPLSDPGSGNRQSLVFARDVTEKRRIEAVLQQSEKLAAVGRLATGVAHEISNPLTAMIGNAQILRRGAVDDDQVEALDMMIEAGERARRVVQNLLDLAGDDHLDLVPLDVNTSIRSAVMTFQGDARFELVMDLADDLPAVDGSLEQLENLWRHLILNAGDALGERKAVILIQSEAVSGGISVRVCEYERNIPDEDLANLFDPYVSLTSTTRGQGVGLTVCRRIVKLHGGDIRVSSKPGEVTTFNVWLPGVTVNSV